MILILSQDYDEFSTEEVMDWLEYLGQPCTRINGADIEDGNPALTLTIPTQEPAIAFNLSSANLQFTLDSIKSVWFRRWQYQPDSQRNSFFHLDHYQPAEQSLSRHFSAERQRLSEFFFSSLSRCNWLGSPANRRQNKLLNLATAKEVGLDIPATLVTTGRDDLAEFAAHYRYLVAKPLGEAAVFQLADRIYPLYTVAIDAQTIGSLPARFPPSLFQEQLTKKYEIRVFFLDGNCYSMAIFSQSDPQTCVDFRNYNLRKPNRCVPYVLPYATEESIVQLMKSLKLDTGSIDLVKTIDNRTVFLEVNPVGQFGMISKTCNYPLERYIAEALSKRSDQ